MTAGLLCKACRMQQQQQRQQTVTATASGISRQEVEATATMTTFDAGGVARKRSCARKKGKLKSRYVDRKN